MSDLPARDSAWQPADSRIGDEKGCANPLGQALFPACSATIGENGDVNWLLRSCDASVERIWLYNWRPLDMHLGRHFGE